MDKLKHRKIQYVEGDCGAAMLANQPQFRRMTELDPITQYYEVELAKKKISLDLPIQIGYFILQNAKLRMLEFYYDCLDHYVDRDCFEMVQMDTGECLRSFI